MQAMSNPELMSPNTHLLAAYGLYLSNGGTPEGFDNLTVDDVRIMYATHTMTRKQDTKDVLEGLVAIVNKMFGGNGHGR